MKDNYTTIALVVDRSGSMESIRQDTIGGINAFIKSHKEDNTGETTISIAQFDHEYKLSHDFVNIQDVKKFTKNSFKPRGMTALLDAIGKTIKDIGEKLSNLPEEERPSKVVVAIITDGEENSSKKYSKDKIQEMIRLQEDVYSWDVMFLGAGMDAVEVAKSYGIADGKAMGYDTDNIRGAFSAIATSSLRAKSGLAVDFTQEEILENTKKV